MSSYLTQHGTRATPQSEQIRADQVKNSAGGFVWEVDPWTRLRRFLILGSEGGSYYATERDLTKQNVQVVRDLAVNDGIRLVNEIRDVSERGLAPKNDPALFALACAISLGDKETRLAAGKALPYVARTATHLYNFIAYTETMRGWGRMLRKAVSEWYNKEPQALAYQAIKYGQRSGWAHRDLLRLAHPSVSAPATRALFDWITHGTLVERQGEFVQAGPIEFETVIDPYPLVRGYVAAQKAPNATETAKLVREYGLPREALNSDHLNDPEVWRALLDVGMPIHALTRNLATMTRRDVLQGDYLQLVVDRLADGETVRKSRLHPLALLIALKTYAMGHGYRGGNTWHPIGAVIDALDEAFYLAFDNVEPTNKRILLALDISGSMGSHRVADSMLTTREAAAAMALVTVHAEMSVDVVTFSCAGVSDGWYAPWASRWASHGIRDGIEPFALSKRQRLDDVVARTEALPMGGTDCALPMIYATDTGRAYDVFQILTDNETWAGNIHPMQALRKYRERSGMPAKLITVGMVANNFTIADPNDAGSMDVVGFDASAPTVMNEFIAGRI